MIKVSVDQPSVLEVRVRIETDEGAGVRDALLDQLSDLFAQRVLERTHNSWTAVYIGREAALKAATTLNSLWGGELLRGVGEGESHVKKLMWEAVQAFRAQFPNTVRINKISPVQVAIENVTREAILTQLDGVAVIGEFTLKDGSQRFVGEYIDGAWSWHLDATGRTA